MTNRRPLPHYRILPYGANSWTIEIQSYYLERTSGYLWWKKFDWKRSSHWSGSEYSIYRTEAEAEKTIDKEIFVYNQRHKNDLLAEERQRTIPPREYP